MIEIINAKIRNRDISVPGSKSYTHRTMIAAALSDGRCEIFNALKSEDTLLTLGALKQMGVRVEELPDRIVIYGTSGELKTCEEPLYLANSGTSMRLLTGIAALGRGIYTLTGTERMLERPIGDLLDGLNQVGVQAKSVNGNGCPPVEVRGGHVKGGRLSLKCGVSSQYLSSLLLIAPCTKDGLPSEGGGSASTMRRSRIADASASTASRAKGAPQPTRLKSRPASGIPITKAPDQPNSMMPTAVPRWV